jgi:hypothetical protein
MFAICSLQDLLATTFLLQPAQDTTLGALRARAFRLRREIA